MYDSYFLQLDMTLLEVFHNGHILFLSETWKKLYQTDDYCLLPLLAAIYH